MTYWPSDPTAQTSGSYGSGGAVGGHLLATARPTDRARPATDGCKGIDHVVWSFWSRPFEPYQHRAWIDRRSHLLSWVLSVRTAAEHFAHTTLVTDDAGAELLARKLALPFERVSTSLNVLKRDDPAWWVLGKLHAYREQERAFLHLDSDVYLWRRPDDALLAGDVIAQNPEHAPATDVTFYKPTWLTQLVRGYRGWLPAEWETYRRGGGASAICAGILGGQDLDTFRSYANRAIAIVRSPRNFPAWRAIDETARLANSVLVEQYYLAAYCDGRRRDGAPVDVRYVFTTQQESSQSAASTRAGYTHLMAGKRDPEITRMLAEHVCREYPEDYVRCVRLT